VNGLIEKSRMSTTPMMIAGTNTPTTEVTVASNCCAALFSSMERGSPREALNMSSTARKSVPASRKRAPILCEPREVAICTAAPTNAYPNKVPKPT